MELQGTLLHRIMGAGLLQEIKTMIKYHVAIVHGGSKVPGGIITAMPQTLTVSTMVDHTYLMLMV